MGSKLDAKIVVSIILISIVFLSGCDRISRLLGTGPSPQEKEVIAKARGGRVLATVNDRVVTLREYRRLLEALPKESKDLFGKDLEGKRRFLELLINNELLIEEAINRRLAQDEEVSQLIESYRDGLLIARLQRMVTEKITVSNDEVEKAYERYKGIFQLPEEVRAREIKVSTEQEAKSILMGLLQGTDFATLALEKSISPSAKQGGDLGVIKPGDDVGFPRLREMVFTLNEGEISGVMKGPDGYYIIKVDKKKFPKQQTLAEVYDEINQGLLMRKQQEAIEKLVGELKKTAKINVNEELLKE